jgi:hypothetical protein
MKTALTLLTVLFFSGAASPGVAQDLTVIKDSEAAQYVCKNVEVHGTVAVVYISRKGSTFLDFWGKYPRQKFTGYIPAGAELAGDSWTATLEGKAIGIS